MFDYYSDTDTLIISLRRWPEDAKTASSGPFSVATTEQGELVEIEIRRASHFLARALAEGIPLPENEGPGKVISSTEDTE